MNDIISLIIPTYNEHDNIAVLVPRISDALNGRNYEIVFIDDNSADGTAEAVEALKEKYPVRVIVRKDKKGLASAVVDGLEHASGDTVLVMDADLQHPPEVIPNLLNAIEKGADIAIASRYVEGGGCQGWGLVRRVISKGAILLSHLLLPSTRKAKDPVSGYFAFRKDIVKDVSLNPSGFKILMEIMVIGNYSKVTEVPFMFVTRQKGESKLNARQQIDYLKHIFSMMQRSGELMRFIKFAMVGGSGVIVNIGLYWLLTRFAGFTPLDDGVSGNILSGNLALTISIEASIITNFILNNYFTFADRNKNGATAFLSRLLNFNLICIIGALIQIGITNLLAIGFGLFDLFSLAIAISVAMIWNYLLNNWWTWRR